MPTLPPSRSNRRTLKTPPPSLNEALTLSINGKAWAATCADVFDGGYGWYIDAVLPKNIRTRLGAGKQLNVQGVRGKYLADFVSYPTNELWKMRLLLPK